MPAFTCNPSSAWAEPLFIKFLELLRRDNGYLIVQLLSVLVDSQTTFAVQQRMSMELKFIS
jgi:hypothetical protein